MTPEEAKKILDLPVKLRGGKMGTLREHLVDYLQSVWGDNGGDWTLGEYSQPIYKALITAGLVEGGISSFSGIVVRLDHPAAKKLLTEVMEAGFMR